MWHSGNAAIRWVVDHVPGIPKSPEQQEHKPELWMGVFAMVFAATQSEGRTLEDVKCWLTLQAG